MKFSFFIVACQLLVIFVAPALSQGSISDIISARGELSKIWKLLQGTTVLEKFRNSGMKLTFFAPHNSAFGNISEQMRSQLNSMMKDNANQIFLYHTVSGLTRTSNLTQTPRLRLQSLADSGPLNMFLYKTGQTVTVNGAGFIEADISATNGVLHIIDSIFVELGPTLSAFAGNIDNYITKQQQATRSQERTTEFESLLALYDESLSHNMFFPGEYGSLLDNVLKPSDGFVTAFIPSDDAVNQFKTSNPEKFQDLTRAGSPTVLQRVLESHAIPVGAYHSSLLIALSNNATVPAMQGRIRMYSYSGDLYVSNNCTRARVTKANITATNGVVYIIDNILGYIINDLETQIQRDNGITEFRGTIAGAPESFKALLRLPDGRDNATGDEKLTVFAPTDYAYSNGFQNDFSQDPAERLEQLNMQLLHGMLQLDQMTNGLQVETLAPGKFAKFYQLPDGVYVDVDYVRGKIVEANICTKNGIIHKVDSILGVPSRTIFQEIANNPRLTFLETVSINTGLQTLLQDPLQHVTMFAPVDEAFEAMSTESPSYLNRQNDSKLRNILNRHIARGLLFLDQIVPANSETTITTYNGEIRIGNENNEYYILIGSRRIRVIQANMRMQNGVLHIIDKVIYDPNDPRTGQSITSSSSSVPSSLFLIVTSIQAFHLL